ncbi:tape measure protein [Klebsiella electrica]|uniref:tape measure protein n=1 Tax=Klebsiella electrica TaxID=1259973 RepID=UPI00255519C6|nr:tape measure protein [Klebsiella electrica]WIO42466.1 tape measure protein [Klebsiella electrica]
MSNGNIIVTKTVNAVTWQVDETSYQKALKRIKSLKTAHEKPAKALEAAQKRATQSEGKAQLQAARAESRRLALNQKLTAESRKQAVINARSAANERQHAQRMAAITARGIVRNPAGRAGLVPKSPKSIAEAIQQAEQEKRTQQIRAKGIRFSTATNGYNLTSRQRAQAIQDFAQLTKQYHAGSMALGEYNARVGKLLQSLRQQGGLVKRPVTIPVKAKVTGLDTSLLDHAGSAITIGATIGIGKSIMQTGQNFESMMNGLQAVTGDPRKAGQEMEYLQQQALKLGLDLQQTSKDYVKFYASASGKATDGQIKNLFEGVSQYGTVLGATGEEQSRALLALNQMYSKGTVQAEELKGQLGDALPNAVGIFVKALNKMKGRTDLTEKDLMGLMKDGELLAKDILPFVGDEFKAAAQKGGAFEKSLKSNRVAMMRLQTTMQIAQKNFFDAGFGASLTKTFDGMTTAINNNQGAIQTLGEIAGDVLDGFRDAAFGVVDAVVILRAVIDKYFPDLAKTFEGFGGTAAYATGIAIFTGALWKLGGALKWIVSFLNPLKGIVGTLGKLGALGGISTPGTDNDKPNKKGGKGFSIGLPAIIAAVSLNDRVGAVQADPDGFLKKVQANNDKPTLWTDIKNFVATTFGSYGGSPYTQGPQLPGINNLAAGIGAGRPVEVEGMADLKVQTEVKLTLDDSKFSDAIRAEVQNHDQQNINMLLGVPN